LSTLREERRKVEGFKRELPLCIELLDEAIKRAEEKLTYVPLEKGNDYVSVELSRRPTLEEFMPLKRRERDNDVEGAEDSCATKNSEQPEWMAEARLWNQTTSRHSSERTRDPEQEHSSVTSTQEQRLAGGGAFSPFQLNAMPVVSRPRPRSGGFCGDLNLRVQGERPATTLRAASEVEVVSTAAAEAAPPVSHSVLATTSGGAGNPNSSGNSSGNLSSARKARRCWSPELHRRFVSALQQLGGSHIATPKQLRELMKVDGLTNDEVKSHLQKYRLHTRRPSASSSPHEAGQQVVVVGGIWMPPAVSQSGSHSGVSDPSQFRHSASLPLDYFTACINNGTPAAAPPAPAAPMQVVHVHRQPIFESPQPGTSQSQNSPQGPLQVTSQLSGATQGSSSDTYESGEEEAKSQSTSWNLCRQNRTVESNQRGEPAEPKKLAHTSV
jgi:SHAQKYF class myb-like DNA-binding protein